MIDLADAISGVEEEALGGIVAPLITRDITQALKEEKVKRFNREGIHSSGWVLLDFSDVIVHIFGPEERQFYGLERLWHQAPQVVRVL